MSKKKKLKKRLGSVSGRAAGIAEQLANVKNQFAPTQQEQVGSLPVSTVGDHVAPISFAPQTSAPAAPVEADDEESWEGDEDENDGGAIAVPQVSAPVVIADEIVIIEETQPKANEEVPQQTEVNQESSKMNVVNHPTQAAQPAVTVAAATEHTNIVAEGAMEQMQHLANTVPPAAATTAAPVSIPTEPAPAKKQSAAFHHLATTVLITLDMSNFGHMTGLKQALSRVKMDGQEFNLYQPFRKAGKKTEANPSAEGVLRYALSGILDMTDAINNSRLMILGSDEEVEEKIRTSMETTRNQIINLFPANPKHIVASLLDEERQATVQLQLEDIVTVRSWVNYSADANDDGSGALIGVHNAAFHITVNAGHLYDTEDRMKYINQIEKLVQMFVEKRDEANTTILFGLLMEGSTLSDASIRQLFDALLAGDEYILYTAKEMHKLESSDFLPQTHEEIDTQVLTQNGDMLLIRLLTDDGDDDEEQVEAGAEGAEDAAAE